MCTWFYAERSTLSPIITKAQQLPLANTIRNTMSRSAEISGNIRPTDMAAVFASISNTLSSSFKWAFYGRINE